MNDTLHWYDLDVTAVADSQSSFVAWRVASIIYVEDGAPCYTRSGAVNSMDVVDSVEAAEVLVQGTVKWDGCADLSFDEHAMIHICGVGHLREFQAVLTRMYEMTAHYLADSPGVAGYDGLPVAREWPSQAYSEEQRGAFRVAQG